MHESRSLSLRYIIGAPVQQVAQVLPLLLEGARQFDLSRAPGDEKAWNLLRVLDQRAVGRISLRGADEEESELLAAPAGSNGHRTRPEELTPILAAIVNKLQAHGFAVRPSAPADDDTPETASVALLVAPFTPFHAEVCARLSTAAAQHEYTLRRPPEEVQDDLGPLERDVEAATMVIADLSIDAGLAAALTAEAEGRFLVPVAPAGTAVPARWEERVLYYGEDPAPLVRALADQIAAAAPTDQGPTVEDHTAGPRDEDTQPGQSFGPALSTRAREEPSGVQGHLVPALEERPTEPPPLPTLIAAPPNEARRAIYRAAALDLRATPERRFHAARVLVSHGDYQVAATALGEIARAATPLRDEALQLLGELGEPGKVALWTLDATEENAERIVAIALQLHRVGDDNTARLRLESLAHHPDRAVRLEALHALHELGAIAHREFMDLLREADDPWLKLEAARWLRSNRVDLPAVVETLMALANRPDHPTLAFDALRELAAVRSPQAYVALKHLAYRADLPDMRLAAAQLLREHGRSEEARDALLAIAQGHDEDTAVEAADVLLAFQPEAPSDTERLMSTAALLSVRRRAASQLAREEHPESVQQEAARVLLALDRPDQAIPTLRRLALEAENSDIRRWAVEQLAGMGEPALPALMEILEATSQRAIGLRAAEAVLRRVSDPPIRRRVARWLAAHDSAPRAAEVLAALARDGVLLESDSVGALRDLIELVSSQPAALRAVSHLAREAPNPAVRRGALEYLIQNHIEELPLATLVDLAVQDQPPVDLARLIEYLPTVATPVAQRIVEEVLNRSTTPPRRWRLLTILTVLPRHVMVSALRQLAARAPGATLREVAAERLLAAGQVKAGLAALANLGQSAAHPDVRRRAVFRLQQHEAVDLLRVVAEQSPYTDTRELAVQLLRELGVKGGGIAMRDRWERWVSRLPLAWLDRWLGLR